MHRPREDDVGVGRANPAAAAAPVGVALRARVFASRRIYFHPKSFDYGVFFIKYRDDQSVLYPERINSWNTVCPYHEGCTKTIQVNQPDEDTSKRRLLQWCLDATKYSSKQATWLI